jgi:hypothetical protein
MGQRISIITRIFISVLIGSVSFIACTKNDLLLPIADVKPCEHQSANPTGRSYAAESVVNYNCTQKHCGILPLSNKNYWVYQDSIFNNGVFAKVQNDTLRFLTQKMSLADGLVWWEGSISVGLPDVLYANDSSFFGIEDRLFIPDIVDVKKEFGLFPGDSLRQLTSFEDVIAQGRSLKLDYPLVTPAGTFGDCLYFEKNARYFRRDQVFFKPGLGVVKYVQEKAPSGSRILKLQQVSTLVSVHIE